MWIRFTIHWHLQRTKRNRWTGIDIIKLSEVDTLNNIEDVVSLIDICDFTISVVILMLILLVL